MRLTVMGNDFNDGKLNGGVERYGKWSYYDRLGALTPAKITEHDGYLDIQMTQTDNEAHAVYTFDQGVVDATINMTRYYHAANNYYMGDTILRMQTAGGDEFRIDLSMMKSAYAPDYSNDIANFNHPRVAVRHVGGDFDLYYASNTTSDLFDTWSNAEIRLDNTAGSIWMDFDGDGNSDLTVTDALLVGASLKSMDFSSFGWYTGHYSYMDSLQVTGELAPAQPADFTEAEVQLLAGLWEKLKAANSIYADATQGAIAGWRELNPDFRANGTVYDAFFEASIWDSVGLSGDQYSSVEYAKFIKDSQKIRTREEFIQAVKNGDFTHSIDGFKLLEFAGDFIDIADTVIQGYTAIRDLLQKADVDGAFDTIENLATGLLAGGAVSLSTSAGVGVTIAGIVGATGVASLMVVGGVTVVVGLGAAKLITELNDHYRITEGVSSWYQTALIEIATNGVINFNADTTPQTIVGDYLIAGGQGDDNLKGGAQDDNLSGSGGDDVLDGGTGADTMFGGTGNDIYIVDNPGDKVVEVDLSLFSEDIDTVRASVSFTAPTDVDNIVLTGAGNIDATGNNENNQIWGNKGNNRISAGRGEDTVRANGGNDTVVVGTDNQADAYFGGKGNDTLLFNTKNGRWGAEVELNNHQIIMSYNDGSDVSYYKLDTHSGFENITGGLGEDILSGNKSANILQGRAGNDVLRGAGGADRLIGGFGKDNMYAGKDTDEDVFVFNSTKDSKKGWFSRKADKIFGFDTGEDKLDFSHIDANTRLKGDQAFEMDIVGPNPVSHGVWVKYTRKGDVLVYADVDGDQKADMLVKLVGLDSISVDDFVL